MMQELPHSPQHAVAHLDPDTWARANRELVRKMISEFAHERLVEPQWQADHDRWSQYRIATDAADTHYVFRARRLQLDHWHVETESIRRIGPDGDAPVSALDFVVDTRERLGIGTGMLPEYLEELTATLYALAYKLGRGAPTAAELIHADFQQIEAAMTDGHPAFIANSGRVGFDAHDYRRYAPETGHVTELVWLAAHRDRVSFAHSEELSYDTLMDRELGPDQRERFHESLRALELAPEDYYFLPVHPWQWYNKLASVFAPELASRHLVCLGPSEDRYQPQQSIRTLFNRSHPERCYVKTALSVLNMGFMRGLSPEYMRSTPPINDWIHCVIESDPVLRESGFSILREIAAIGYRHPIYQQAADKSSPYRKMLSALWRESPVPRVEPHQRLTTMAALLHRDRHGRAVVSELIRASRLSVSQWLDQYLRCYLAPLLHCFYRHDLVFMPHGENLILVLSDHVPVRCFMKDVGEEVAVMDEQAELPEAVQRIAVHVPEDLRVLSLFTDIFDYIFRYLAAILVEAGECTEELFWDRVAACIHDYQRAHPELADKFARYDLFAPEFRRSCMNRLQFANNRQLIDLADPTRTLQFAGTLDNPIAGKARRGATGSGTRMIG